MFTLSRFNFWDLKLHLISAKGTVRRKEGMELLYAFSFSGPISGMPYFRTEKDIGSDIKIPKRVVKICKRDIKVVLVREFRDI